MNYEKYKNTRDAVWRLLIDQGIDSLPIDIVSICNNLGVKVKGYVSTDESDGYSCYIDGAPYIFVNTDTYTPRRRFTIAHELGHIILGHVGKFELINREPSTEDNPIEQEANVFASRLLAPACVLWGCGVKSAKDIERLCDISSLSAEYRMERLKILYKRNRFLSSPLERKVYHQFKDYIDKNRI